MKILSNFLTNRAFHKANLSFDLSTGVRIEVRNQAEWRIYNDIFADNDYDESLLKLISPESVQSLHVVDLGTNVGFFILRLLHLVLAQRAPHHITIQGVEGSSMLCLEAGRRIKASKFPVDQFQINVAKGLIGQPDGVGTLYQLDNHGLNSVFRKNGKPEQVPFLNISTLLGTWEKIDLLKCDIEGAELSFLKNYPDILVKTKSAVFEFHPEFCDYEECLTIIRAGGFLHSKILRKSPYSSIEFFWK